MYTPNNAKTVTIIHNADNIISELLPVVRIRSKNNRQKLENLKIGQGFTTKGYKVAGLRCAAKKLEMKISAYEIDPDIFLICRKF